jgi:hypothetical protein
MFGSKGSTSAPIVAALSTKRVGILQAVLHGVPDPDEASVCRSVLNEGGLLHKVVYGVKDDEEVVVDAKVVGKQNGGEKEDLVVKVEVEVKPVRCLETLAK